MWGNPKLFHQANLLKKIFRKDKYWHNQLRKALLKKSLTLSWRRPLSYRNQSLRKSMDWFLYDHGLHHEKVNGKLHFLCSVGVLRESCSENMQQIYRKLLKICSKVSQVSQENIHYHLKMKANLLEWKNVR